MDGPGQMFSAISPKLDRLSALYATDGGESTSQVTSSYSIVMCACVACPMHVWRLLRVPEPPS